MMSSNNRKSITGSLLVGLAVTGLLGLTACSDMLDVDDPDIVQPEQLEGPAAVPVRTAGIYGSFQEALDGYVLYSGLLIDEFVLAGTFPTREEVDERRVLADNATLTDGMYGPIHTARAFADNTVEVFQDAVGDPEFEGADLQQGIAVGTTLGGYSRILLAEGYCHSILGGQQEGSEEAPLSPDARMQQALSVLQDAESEADAAGDDDLVNLARVGQARAQLWLGNYAEAANIASQVPTEFVFQMEYSSNTRAQDNEVHTFSWANTQALRWTVGNGEAGSPHGEMYPYYDEWVDQGLLVPPVNEAADEPSTDPVAEPDHGLVAFNNNTPVTLQTPYGGTDPYAAPPAVSGEGQDADIVLASGWEARMIEAEFELREGAAGAAETIVNDLLTDASQANNPIRTVNSNVPVGAFNPVTFTGDLQNDLPELARARAAGLFISGTRLGTLRRFLEDGVNLYPQGTEGDDTEFPIVQQEIDNNPSVSQGCP